MYEIPDAPWIGNDDYGRNDGLSRYDIEFECQDDDRDNEIYNSTIEEENYELGKDRQQAVESSR